MTNCLTCFQIWKTILITITKWYFTFFFIIEIKKIYNFKWFIFLGRKNITLFNTLNHTRPHTPRKIWEWFGPLDRSDVLLFFLFGEVDKSYLHPIWLFWNLFCQKDIKFGWEGIYLIWVWHIKSSPKIGWKALAQMYKKKKKWPWLKFKSISLF